MRAPMSITIILMPIMLWVIASWLEEKLHIKTVPQRSNRFNWSRLTPLLLALLVIEQQTSVHTLCRGTEFVTVSPAETGEFLLRGGRDAFSLVDSRTLDTPYLAIGNRMKSHLQSA